MDLTQITGVTDVFATGPVVAGVAIVIGSIAIVVLAIMGGKWLLGAMKK